MRVTFIQLPLQPVNPPGRPHVFSIAVRAGADPSIASLLEAIDGSVLLPSHITVDGCSVPVTQTLSEAGVVDGTVLSTEPPRISAPSTAFVDVVAGCDAGRRFPLITGRNVIGRTLPATIQINAATVDHNHLAIDHHSRVTSIFPLTQANGILYNGQWVLDTTPVSFDRPIDLGATHLVVRRDAVDAIPDLAAMLGRTSQGTISFNRPPRNIESDPSPTISIPTLPTPSMSQTVFGWAGFLAPLLLGIAMAVLYNPLFALFALLSPVMVLASWWENRRRDRKMSLANHRRTRAVQRQLAAAAQQWASVHGLWLRRRFPDPAEVIGRTTLPSVRLWERRLPHDDSLQLVVGYCSQQGHPKLQSEGPIPDELAAMVAQNCRLDSVPFEISLDAGRCIGLVGPRSVTLALANSLLIQTTTLHGPADVSVVALLATTAAAEWDWLHWLPHTAGHQVGLNTRTIATSAEGCGQLAADLCEKAHSATQTTVVLIDGNDLVTDRHSPGRLLLAQGGGPTSGIVIANSVHDLPAACTEVICVTDIDGIVEITQPASGQCQRGVLMAGVSRQTATQAAQALARHHDPEIDITQAAIPSQVSLLRLLGLPQPTAPTIAQRWQSNATGTNLQAVIGSDGDGPITIDLVTDGPHALVGGTTGSGKSELLVTLIASLAATTSPTHLNFVLIDYKGGSAFDCCADLPHCVGLVTDLDDHLAERALRSLEAELRHREHELRRVGASDLIEFYQQGHSTLARLVVVIDEFATLASELPDFVEALVGIAQRGRSLGVHLVLATQRPSGSVSANIKTNTNLRIALRTLDASDSIDVINTPDAAHLGRDQPGRAYIRLGPGELVAFQSALITGHTTPGAEADLLVRPVVCLADAEQHTTMKVVDGPTDLERLTAACTEAAAKLPLPRRPWIDPLRELVTTHELQKLTSPLGQPHSIPVGLVDLPSEQRHEPYLWDMGSGNLVLTGLTGSGTSSALIHTLITAADSSPSDIHIYGIDYDGSLAAMEAHPAVGSIIPATDADRQRRLLSLLDAQIRTRRSMDDDQRAALPRIICAIDNFGAFQADLESRKDHAQIEQLRRLYAEGSALGVGFVIAADHPSALGRHFLATTPSVVMLRLADPTDYLTYGIRVSDPATMPAGRGFLSENGHEIQLGFCDSAQLQQSLNQAAPTGLTVPPIGSLPTEVSPALLGIASAENDMVTIPIGIGETTLQPIAFTLHRGEHALIAGRVRSGKSSMLQAIARLVSASGLAVIGLAPPHSPLHGERSCAAVVQTPAELVTHLERCEQAVVLVDDATSFTDLDGALQTILSQPPCVVTMIVAGRTDRLGKAFGHWTQTIRESRVGVLLNPDILDGDLLGCQLPSRLGATGVGRGWIVNGTEAQRCQAATVQGTTPTDIGDYRSRLTKSA